MPSSGTYAFELDNADLIEEAFERCGVDPATLVARHFRSALRSLNLLFTRWSTKGVRLFVVEESTQTLTDGDADYAAATGTLAILETVIRRDGVDTPVHRITREAYHLIPNKTDEGLPSQIYYDRAANTYYLWNVPENSTDQLRYMRLRRMQDATSGLETPDVHHIWLEALCAGLAEFLALKHAPDRHDKLRLLAAEAFADAKGEDRERADTTFDVGG